MNIFLETTFPKRVKVTELTEKRGAVQYESLTLYHMSSYEDLGYLLHIGGYTTQLYRDENKPL